MQAMQKRIENQALDYRVRHLARLLAGGSCTRIVLGRGVMCVQLLRGLRPIDRQTVATLMSLKSHHKN
jgi:hypothetical protein